MSQSGDRSRVVPFNHIKGDNLFRSVFAVCLEESFLIRIDLNDGLPAIDRAGPDKGLGDIDDTRQIFDAFHITGEPHGTFRIP